MASCHLRNEEANILNHGLVHTVLGALSGGVKLDILDRKKTAIPIVRIRRHRDPIIRI